MGISGADERISLGFGNMSISLTFEQTMEHINDWLVIDRREKQIDKILK